MEELGGVEADGSGSTINSVGGFGLQALNEARHGGPVMNKDRLVPRLCGSYLAVKIRGEPGFPSESGPPLVIWGNTQIQLLMNQTSTDQQILLLVEE